MPNSENRKLAAILFADIVGYTATMQSNEPQALSRLQKFKFNLEKEVPALNGKIIQFYGDGCLCVFNSSVDAVACAKKLQTTFQSEPKVPVRIGLHAGDIVFKEGNVFGDAVNIASRVESMGISGSVLLSSNVRNQIKNQPDFKLESLGKFEFKNVQEGMTVYALANEGLAIPKKGEIKGKLKEPIAKKSSLPKILAAFGLLLLLGLGVCYFSNTDTNSNQIAADNDKIAIFPFEVKGSSDIQYLGEGMVDLLATKLDGIPKIKPIDPNLIFNKLETNKRVTTDLGTTITQNFQAGKFVLGSIIELNDNIEITASKYDQNGTRLDKKSVSGLKSDLASLVDELTRTLIASEVIATGEESTSIGVLTSDDIPALKAFLQGEQAFRKADIEAAYDYYLKATTLDSTFAIAWWRLQDAADWKVGKPNHGADEQIEKYKHKLPEKYLALKSANQLFRQVSPKAEANYLDLLRKYGEFPELTNELGECIYHTNMVFGKPFLTAKTWFQKTRVLNPINQEPSIHLLEIALAENDLAAIQEIFQESDYNSLLWPFAKRNMLYFQDTVTLAEIKEVAHHPKYSEIMSYIIFAAPDNPTKYYHLLERILKERDDQKPLVALHKNLAIFGKEAAAFEYTKPNPLFGKIGTLTYNDYYVQPALFIGQHNYRPFSEHYDTLAASAAESTSPAALYAQCKYALVLNQPTVYKKAKQQLVEQRKIERLNNHSSYFLFSLMALEAQQQGDDEQALIWVDSALQYNPGHNKAKPLVSDKTIIKAQILEEQGDFKQAIALYENIDVGAVYHLMKGFATYNLGRLYEKDGQYDKAIAKSELLIDLYKDCDEKYQPWVEEAKERRDRLRARKL